ncbi:MAG TPA: sialidase family protein [Gemmatimonadaceae bacterium]|nr:sialidase family protein [Gemmatimonadaceae bacterium]
MPRRPTSILAVVPLLCLAVVWGCGGDRVEWTDAEPLPPAERSAPDVAFEGGQLVPLPFTASMAVPVIGSQCAGSVQSVRAAPGDWYAAWWAVRPDSTADVVVSRSSDGRSWTAPVRVDTTDVGRSGCQRPAPSLSADAGNVHVAYAMVAREGPGVFAAHSMDRGATFHTPVTIVYGERIGRSAIAARGNLVVVAYEDPNSDPRRVDVAVSRTMGHTYEPRQVVSPPTGEASAPRVALGDDRIAVIWSQSPVTGARGGEPRAEIPAGAVRMVRVGVLR